MAYIKSHEGQSRLPPASFRNGGLAGSITWSFDVGYSGGQNIASYQTGR